MRKYLSDDTRFALSLPLRGPLPFTSHGRLAVREGTFLLAYSITMLGSVPRQSETATRAVTVFF